MKMTEQTNLTEACNFYKKVGALDTAAEVAKRIGDFTKADSLYERAI